MGLPVPLRDLLPQRARRLALGLALVALAVMAEMGLSGQGGFSPIDRVLYDVRARSQTVRPAGQLVIVDLDERSLAEQGPWPWAPEKIAALIEKVGREGGARTLGLDLVLSSTDTATVKVLQQSVASLPVVVGFRFSNEFGLVPSGRLPEPTWLTSAWAQSDLRPPAWRSFSANTPALVGSAQASGFFNAPPDRDGTVRSMPLVAQYKGGIYPSLAVAVLQVNAGGAPIRLVSESRHGRALAVGRTGNALILPMAENGTVLVPVQGEGGRDSSRFRHVSASDVLADRVDRRLFQDRIVLIGSSAPAMTDLLPSASGERFTEVELQASLIAGALEGNLRTAPEVGSLVSAVVLGVVGTLLAVAMSAAAVPSVIGLMLLGVSIFTGWNTVAYARLDWVLPLGSGLLMLFGLALINLVASYLLEGRARRAVIRLFGQYVAPQLVARMADDPHHAPLQSQDKELTILFADIRGFTRMAERMDPQQLREVLNRFLTVMTEVVHAHQGTLDKYIGDAVMAFWGAPLEDAQHADHAVAAAIAMQEALDDLNLEFARRGLPALSMGIGINTGVVRVGDMGSQLRRSYTVIGDAVNLAARLEGISKDQGIPVAVGDSTRRQVNALALEFVGQLQVQGRDEAVRVWQPVTLRSAVWSQPAAPEPLANRMIESREPLESSGRRDLIEQLGPGEQRHSRERVA